MINAEIASHVKEKRFTLSDKKDSNPKKDEEETKLTEEKETQASSNHSDDKARKDDELTKLRSEVNQLSDNLQTTVIDLKKSIVDIRSAVSEIENPFNLLRTISSEKDLKKINGERLPPGVKSLILGNPEENESANDEPVEEKCTKVIEHQPSPEPEQEPLPKTEPKKEEAPTPLPELEPQLKQSTASSAYLDWIWGLLDSGLKAIDIHQLACSCEVMGYLPPQTNEFIYSLAVAAEKLREKGFTKGHLLLNLYKAATISKISIDQEDVQALIAITEEHLKRSKPAKGVE
jgi:hypothetical protein